MAVAQSRARSSKELKLDLPMLSIQVRPPDLRMPNLTMPHVEMPHLQLPRMSRQEVGHAVDVARTFLPPPERIAYYGALGVLAAVGVLEWPVAAAIGAGTMIARRRREGEEESGSPARRTQASRPADERSPAATAAPKRATSARRTAAPKRATSGRGAASARSTASSTPASKSTTSTTATSTTAASKRASSTTSRGARKSTAGRARSGG